MLAFEIQKLTSEVNTLTTDIKEVLQASDWVDYLAFGSHNIGLLSS